MTADVKKQINRLKELEEKQTMIDQQQLGKSNESSVITSTEPSTNNRQLLQKNPTVTSNQSSPVQNSQDKEQSFNKEIKALAANLIQKRDPGNNHGLDKNQLETLQKAFMKLSTEDQQRVKAGQFSEIKITATTTDAIRKGLGNKGISTADAQALFSNLTEEKLKAFDEARQARKVGNKKHWKEKINSN